MEKKFEVNEFALEAVRHFEFSGTLINVRPFGNGHINDTYLAEYDIFGMGQVKVIIQRMNRNVFKQPEELMENIVNVTTENCFFSVREQTLTRFVSGAAVIIRRTGSLIFVMNLA